MAADGKQAMARLEKLVERALEELEALRAENQDLRGRLALHHRVCGGEHEQRALPVLLRGLAQTGKARQRGNAARDDRRRRRDPVVGQTVPGRQFDHFQRGREESQAGAQGADLLAVGGDVHQA